MNRPPAGGHDSHERFARFNRCGVLLLDFQDITMTIKKASSTETPSLTKPALGSARAQPAPVSEAAERYHSHGTCVIGFSQTTCESVGPNHLKQGHETGTRSLGRLPVTQDSAA